MKTTFLVLDGVLADFNAARREAIGRDYELVTYEKDGEPYRVNTAPVPWHSELETVLGTLLGGVLDVKLTVLRLDLEGEMPKTHVHADSIEAAWAWVLYLNDRLTSKGGTALFKHKTVGLDAVPTAEECATAGWDHATTMATLEACWRDPAQWEFASFADMRPNRCVVYPAKMFHSRYPQKAFGAGPLDGRLVHVGFFNLT